jgi:hypothetical protein
MTDKSRDYEQELADIVNALAESTLEMSDEEIELEIREEGLDPKIVADQVREIMKSTVKSCRQRLLIEAEREYENRINAMNVANYSIPESPSAQRDLITSILASNPQLVRGLLTAQSRDFNSLPDEDLPAFVTQLMSLVAGADVTKEGDESDE